MTVFLSALAIMAVDLVIRILRREDRPGGGSPAGRGLFRWLRVAVNVVGLVSLAGVAATRS